MADVVEIADDRHADALLQQPIADVRNRGGGLVPVDGDAHQLRTRARERGDLAGRRLDIGGVRIGHRLHDDRRAAADDDRAFARADAHRDRPVAGAGSERFGGFDRHGWGDSGRLRREAGI